MNAVVQIYLWIWYKEIGLICPIDLSGDYVTTYLNNFKPLDSGTILNSRGNVLFQCLHWNSPRISFILLKELNLWSHTALKWNDIKALSIFFFRKLLDSWLDMKQKDSRNKTSALRCLHWNDLKSSLQFFSWIFYIDSQKVTKVHLHLAQV